MPLSFSPLQYLSCVLLCLDFLGQKDALHDTLLVEDEGGAEGAHVLPSVHRLLAPGAEGLAERLLGVGNEVKGNWYFSMNRWWLRSSCTLTPSTS